MLKSTFNIVIISVISAFKDTLLVNIYRYVKIREMSMHNTLFLVSTNI